jgi:ElaB/YqjD/DUF883 family membrane-anchored ribosome-binding protein
MRNGALQTPLRDLRKDLRNVARDAEALLRATADITGERVQEARTRTEKTVRQALEHLYDARVDHRVRRVARDTDRYVRERPWVVVGAAAGIGLLIGLMARRD